MATRMQQRRGTAAQWISTNSGNGPVLNPGEIGWESDTNKFKIGDGVNHWINLSYFVDLNTTIAGAPGLLNSLDELAAAIGDDPAFFTTVATNLTNHQNDTTAIHGIADTSLLVTTTGTQTLTNKTLTSPAINTPTGITKSDVGLSNVDNTTDANKPVSTATQTALDLKSPLASPTFTGTVVLPAVSATGHIIPSVDNTYDLGSPTRMFKDIYVGPGSLYVNGSKVLSDVSGAIVVSADPNENLGLRTSGSGNIELDPTGTGSINIKGPMVMETGSNISNADGNAVTFGGAINTDTISSKTTNTDLSITANGTGKVYLNDNAEVSGNLVVGGNLTISGTTTSVNTETISLADNIIDLNSNFTTGTPTENAGLRIMRGDSNSVQVRWNESTDKWEFTTDGTNYSVIAGLDSPTFTGTVSGVTKAHVGLSDVDNTSDAAKPISTATQTALDAKASNTDLSTHASDTTSIHGIADTNELATKEYVTTAVGNATIDQTGQGGVGITWNTVTEAFDIDNTVATLTGAQTLTDKTLTSPVINAPTGITKSDVGLANVDNTTDANKPVSTATQTALDLKLASATAATTYETITNVALKAPLASPALTGTPTAPTATAGTNSTQVATTAYADAAVAALVDAAPGTLNTLNEIAAAINDDASYAATITTALGLKAPLASPTFTGTVSGITKSMVGLGNVDDTSDASKPISTATQTALDLKLASATAASTYAPIASPTFTGTVSGVTATHVGLGNVDNTSDANKPVSTATQTALDLKAPLASPAFTGTITLPQGKLTGGSTTVSANTATTVSTVALADFTTMEYTVSIKQGSKIRSSKVLVQTDGTAVDSVEHSILETGGAMTGVNVTAAVSSTNCILTVTITNASTTNAAVKVVNTII